MARVLLSSSINAEEMYISNPDNASVPGGDSGADFISTLSPSLNLGVERKRSQFNFSVGANAKFYKRDSSQNYIAYSGRAAAKRQFLGGGTGFLSSALAYTRTSDSLADSIHSAKEPVEGAVAGLQAERTGRLSNSWSTGFNYMISGDSTLALFLNEDFLFNENSRLIDTRTDSAALNYRNRLAKTLDASLGYSFSNTSFDAYDYSFGSSENGENTRAHSANMGLSWAFSRVTGFAFSGGYFITDGADSVDGWTASADLNTSSKLVKYDLGYARSMTSSYGLTREINVNQSVTAGASAALSRSLSISLGGSSSQNRSEPTVDAESWIYSGSLGVNYTPSLFWALSFTVSASHLESRQNKGDKSIKDSWDAGLSLSYQYSRSLFFRAGYSRFQEWARGGSGLSFSRNIAFIAINVKPSGGDG